MNALIITAALFIWSPPNTCSEADYTWRDISSVEVSECRSTFCEDWELRGDDLVCFDSDELYPAGHWSLDIGPDQGDLQAVVEY